ncbi:MAG TPA: plasmid pRiA4b ORF-3 family protein [Chitinophagales bacterium]|nr:plasmid pRiA4b ORF-3 family protein [Chitinophagales bacterium]
MAKQTNLQDKIYQILISLKDSKPKIWRRVLIPADSMLEELHAIIQIVMGWDDSHLHQFIKNKTYYTVKLFEDDYWNEANTIDYIEEEVGVSSLLKAKKDKMMYEYDFGDEWQHEILLEEILPVDDAITYPICIDGKRRCPPEDCGGIWGYANLLTILSQPDHEQYEDMLEWVGEDFDPEYFDKTEVNEALQSEWD